MKFICLMLLLGSLVCIPFSGHSYSMIEKHWQEGMSVGGMDLHGTLQIKEVSWLWQTNPVNLSKSDDIRVDMRNRSAGMSLISKNGVQYYILEGHTSSLSYARPGLQPSVSLLQINPVSPRIQIQGEGVHGKIRYGDITFKINHILAYQDHFMADTGWGILGKKSEVPDIARRLAIQFDKVLGYNYQNKPSDNIVRDNAFIDVPEKAMKDAGYGEGIAGAWITSLEDIKINFPETEEPVKRWQGALTPVVFYF
ncbi:fimbrial protein [Escherichia coli]